MKRKDIVKRRRQFKAKGFATLQDVGMDGDWVTPIQKLSHCEDGPVIVAYYWWTAEKVIQHREKLQEFGYFPGLKFNRVIDLALEHLGRSRQGIYITQAFHLLPKNGAAILRWLLYNSFNQITKYEIQGRPVVALGGSVQAACRQAQVEHIRCAHPDARGRTVVSLADELVNSYKKASELTGGESWA